MVSLIMVGCSSYPCEYVETVGYIESKEYVLVKCSANQRKELKNEDFRPRSVVR
jgi:hypothetical protein